MRYSHAVLCLVILAGSGIAAPQGVGARTNAMGGAEVASSNYRNAALSNPALLARHKARDDFGVVLPALSLFAADPDDLIDSADAFVNEFNRIEDIFNLPGVPTQADLDSLAASLLDLDGRILNFEANAGFTVAVPSESLGIAVVVENRIGGRSFMDVDPADAAAISGALGGGALPTLLSNAVVSAALVSNYGVAVARTFEVAGKSLSVGITPKIQMIETFNYRIDASDFDEDNQEDDFTDASFRRSDSNFNVDAGLLLEATDNVAVGLSLRNLISTDIESVTTLGEMYTYSLEPMATVGASWKAGPLTLAADYDLTETEPFDFAPGSRFVGVGAELGWRWAQLRAGYRMDLEDEQEDVVTAGLGFSPWGVFTMDLAGAVGDETYGASLQLGWSF